MKIIKSKVRYKEPETFDTAFDQSQNQKPYKPVYAGEAYEANIDESLEKHSVVSWDYRDPNVATRVEKAIEQLQDNKVPAGENAYFVSKIKKGLVVYTIEATCTNGVIVGAGQYIQDATVTLTVTPNEHYSVTSASDWSGLPAGATLSSDFKTATWTCTADVSGITCTCVEDAKHTITLTAPTYGTAKMTVNGLEVASPYYDYDGTEVTLTYTPSSYRAFASWGNGSSTFDQNPYTFSISGDVTFHVNDYSTAYLTFEGSSFTTINLQAGAEIQMCDDDEVTATSTWQNFSPGTAHPVENNKVHVRGLSGSTPVYGFTGSFDTVSGPLMSLVNYNDVTVDLVERQFASVRQGTYSAATGLFTSTSLSDASGLILPSKTATACYESMFEQCTALLNYDKCPTLSATTLSECCYYKMFYGTHLAKGPQLPARDVPAEAYTLMFAECTYLTGLQGVGIAAENVTGNKAMSYMFSGCTSLTTSPTINVVSPTATDGAYFAQMFLNCSSLSNVTCNVKFNTTTGNFTQWLEGCAASGIVKGMAETSYWTTESTSGIPSGWTYIKQS